jgi:hypothetical protein
MEESRLARWGPEKMEYTTPWQVLRRLKKGFKLA